MQWKGRVVEGDCKAIQARGVSKQLARKRLARGHTRSLLHQESLRFNDWCMCKVLYTRSGLPADVAYMSDASQCLSLRCHSYVQSGQKEGLLVMT